MSYFYTEDDNRAITKKGSCLKAELIEQVASQD